MKLSSWWLRGHSGGYSSSFQTFCAGGFENGANGRILGARARAHIDQAVADDDAPCVCAVVLIAREFHGLFSL